MNGRLAGLLLILSILSVSAGMYWWVTSSVDEANRRVSSVREELEKSGIQVSLINDSYLSPTKSYRVADEKLFIMAVKKLGHPSFVWYSPATVVPANGASSLRWQNVTCLSQTELEKMIDQCGKKQVDELVFSVWIPEPYGPIMVVGTILSLVGGGFGFLFGVLMVVSPEPKQNKDGQ